MSFPSNEAARAASIVESIVQASIQDQAQVIVPEIHIGEYLPPKIGPDLSDDFSQRDAVVHQILLPSPGATELLLKTLNINNKAQAPQALIVKQMEPHTENSIQVSTIKVGTINRIQSNVEVYDPIFVEIGKDLDQSNLTKVEVEDARLIIRGLEKLGENLDKIEDGLINGNYIASMVLEIAKLKCHSDNYKPNINSPVSFEMFKNSLLSTINVLVNTYRKDRDQNRLTRFFSCAFGPGCLEHSSERILQYATKIDNPIGRLSCEIELFQKAINKSGPVDLIEFIQFLQKKGFLEEFGIDSADPRNNLFIQELEKKQLIQSNSKDKADQTYDEFSIWLADNAEASTLENFKSHLKSTFNISENEVGLYLREFFTKYPDMKQYLS
jgi:hypothetical protein